MRDNISLEYFDSIVDGTNWKDVRFVYEGKFI